MKKRLVSILMILGIMTATVGCNTDTITKVERDYDVATCVTLGDYKELTKTVAKATEEEINVRIQNELDIAGTPEQVTEGIVAMGDTVNIDYVGKKDGVAFDGGTAQGYDLGIGSGSFIDGFEDGLVGVGVGDIVDLNLTFPADYPSTELAGQAVVFTVTVNYIHGDIVAPTIEEYVASNNYESVDAYREMIAEEINQTNEDSAEQEVWATAVGNATIHEYPQSEIDAAMANMKDYYTQLATAWGMDLNTLLAQMDSSEETFEKDMLEYAELAVAEKLVAIAIAEKENITVSDKEYNAKIKEYLETYEAYATKEEIEEVIEPDTLKDQLLMEEVMQFVADSAVEK